MTRDGAKPMHKRITSFDVAQRADVSQSTVSRVLSNDQRMTLETREKVLEAARELGYQPNAMARSLITQRSQIIGLVTSDLSNPFFPHVLEVFTERLHAQGWMVLLFTTGRGESIDDLLPSVLAYQVDGLIIASAGLSSTIAETCLQRGVPVVLFNRYALTSGASAVVCDNIAGGRAIADLLLDAGCSRPAYIAGREDSSTNRDRERGFRERLHERGASKLLREPGTYSYEAGFVAAKRLLEMRSAPDAIFCANDITALGALDAARALKWRVPEDLAVVGFDDIPAASWGAHNLTTVRQPVSEMIDLSIQILLERIENPKLQPSTHFLPGTLIERASVRAKRDSLTRELEPRELGSLELQPRELGPA